ncbi:MAG: YajQ family cyclic di-GMP-binding protein [Candidatus Methylomirabilaceae bacterium]
MAKDSSFDISSTVDLQEVDNAVQQAMKEIGQRFDFKGSPSRIDRDELALTLHADDEYKLRAMVELLESKLVRRKVSLKALDYQPPEPAAKGTVRQRVHLRQGISAEKVREIVKVIKGLGLKTQAQIQGDQVRVSAKSKDDLQTIIQELRGRDLGIDLQFGNYR